MPPMSPFGINSLICLMVIMISMTYLFIQNFDFCFSNISIVFLFVAKKVGKRKKEKPLFHGHGRWSRTHKNSHKICIYIYAMGPGSGRESDGVDGTFLGMKNVTVKHATSLKKKNKNKDSSTGRESVRRTIDEGERSVMWCNCLSCGKI